MPFKMCHDCSQMKRLYELRPDFDDVVLSPQFRAWWDSMPDEKKSIYDHSGPVVAATALQSFEANQILSINRENK